MNVNAKNVEAMAQRKEDENYELRAYLKQQDRLSEEELDQLVFEITRRVWSGFDCTTCANCCKALGRSVTDGEAHRLATRLGLAIEDFGNRFLESPTDQEDDEDDDSEDGQEEVCWRLRGKPCPFLKDNRCTVYEDRPGQCRWYPYLYEKDFSFRTLGMIERTATCPIVYQVFEEMKAELPFRRRRHEQW